MKNWLGFACLFLALIIFSTDISNITGNIINENFDESFVPLNLIAVCFLFASILVFTSKKGLDAIIVPTGDEVSDVERPRTAAKVKSKYYLVSGYIDKRSPISEQQTATIYRELRRNGITPGHMKIEGKSHDSLENALYSFEKLKGMEEIGIVSYPLHLKRYEKIIDVMKEEGKLSKDMKIIYIPTKESFKNKIYGILGLIREKYRLRNGIKEAQKHKMGWFGNLIKGIVRRL